MVQKTEEYKNVEFFIKQYVNHGLEGLAAFRGILEYALCVDDIDYDQSKQLLDDFVGRMLVPEDYEE